MTKFRPCIDLHDGEVKQIVGGTLDSKQETLKINFVSPHPPSYFSHLYRENGLHGGHVIKLGPGNEEAAIAALAGWPNCLQLGGGITNENALTWLSAGAAKVIVTSHLFPANKFSLARLQTLATLIGKDNLVVDISCRKRGEKWIVATNKWQDLTDMEVNQESVKMLEEYCSEFLIHAADVEGLCMGIDEELVSRLGEWCTIPTTYAGGAKDVNDLDLVKKLSNGKIDLTFGSALDVFGGTKVKFMDLLAWNSTHGTA